MNAAHSIQDGREKAPADRGFSAEFRLCGCLRRDGDDIRRIDQNEASVLATVLKADYARDLRKQRVVLAATDVRARLQWGAALAHDDAPAQNCLAAKHLDAKPLGV